MKASVETAIKLLSDKITADIKADDALKYTQAALNLAHVLLSINNLKQHAG